MKNIPVLEIKYYIRGMIKKLAQYFTFQKKFYLFINFYAVSAKIAPKDTMHLCHRLFQSSKHWNLDFGENSFSWTIWYTNFFSNPLIAIQPLSRIFSLTFSRYFRCLRFSHPYHHLQLILGHIESVNTICKSLVRSYSTHQMTSASFLLLYSTWFFTHNLMHILWYLTICRNTTYLIGCQI